MRKQTKLWKTKDGSKIRICDMEDSHLDNTIKFLERYKHAKENYLISPGFDALCSMQGEYAIMSIESELDYLMDYGLPLCDVHPLFKNLLLEQERRKTMEKDTTTDNKKEFYKVSHSFFIAGVQHHQMHKVLQNMEVNDRLQLVLEPTNKYDPNAVRIERVRVDGGDVMCGYVPKKFSSEVTAAFEVGISLECVIVELNKTAKPWEQCKVEIREVD